MYHCSIRLLGIAIAVCLAPAAAHAQPATENFPIPETYFPALKGLIDTAAKQSPRMLARNTENAVAEANRIIARSGQLPSAGGYLSYYPWVSESRAVGPDANGNPQADQTLHPKKLTYNFSITQPIFHWGAIRANTRIGELQEKITRSQTGEAYRLLVDEIRAQYLQVIVNKATLARTRFNQRVSDEQLTLARSKREKNVISEADMFSPTVTAEQARLATDRAADGYESALIYLSKLTGSPVLSDDQIPTTIPPVVPVSSTLQSLTAEFTSRPEIESFALQGVRDQIETERLNYKIAAARLRPKLNLAVGVSQDEFSYSVNIADKYKVQSYYAGVALSWSIFDGFATRSSKRISLARRRQLEENLRNQSEDTVAAARTQLRQLDYAARNLAIVEKMLGSATNVLTARKEDIARGIASDADVNSAQLSFYDWELAAYGARIDYLMRVARLLSNTQNDPALINLPLPSR